MTKYYGFFKIINLSFWLNKLLRKVVFTCPTYLWFAFLCMSELNAVHHVHDFKEVIQAVSSAPSATLLVLDADNVILEYKDMSLRPCGTQLRRELEEKLAIDLEGQQAITLTGEIPLFEHLKCRIIQKTQEKSTCLLDQDLLTMLELVKKRKMKAIGLTDGKIGPYGEWADISLCRISQLDRVGVSFRDFFEADLPCRFDDVSFMNSPVFREGVLFSGKNPKGRVLLHFLETMNLKPEKVIVVDDKLRHLVEIEHQLSGRGISVDLFYLEHNNFMSDTLDKQLIQYKYKHLQKKHEWLSDAEAVERMNR